MELVQAGRKIMYDGNELADLNPSASVTEVVRMHATNIPALATAVVEGPEMKDGVQTYSINVQIGTKG